VTKTIYFIIINSNKKINVNFNVPTRGRSFENNQTIFDNLKAVGFVPNIYAAMGHSKKCFRAASSLSKEKKVLTWP
jgi:hypothetical protein